MKFIKSASSGVSLVHAAPGTRHPGAVHVSSEKVVQARLLREYGKHVWAFRHLLVCWKSCFRTAGQAVPVERQLQVGDNMLIMLQTFVLQSGKHQDRPPLKSLARLHTLMYVWSSKLHDVV